MRSSRWVSVLALVGLLDVRAWGQSVPLGTEFQVNEFWTAPQFAASVAVDGAGNFVVVWQDERYYSPVPTSLQTRGISTRDIFGRRFDSLGTALSSDFRVTDPNDPNFPNPRRPVVARSFSGDFVVAWESPGPPYGYGAAIAARPFNSVGDALGAAFQVNTNSARRIERPDMAMDSAGNFVVVWERYDMILQAQGRGYLTIANVAAQRFNALAAPISGEFQVDPDPNSPSDPNQPDSDQPSVAMNKTTGEFVVVWHHTDYLDGSSSSIRAQRFDNTGGRLSSDFQVNTVTQYDQYVPSVSTNAAGDFMVVWTDSSAANSNVAARVFDSQGNGLTTDIPVNIVTALDQGIPDVSGGDAASGNRFVVTWQSYTQLAPDSSRHGVFARSFSSAGVPLEPEFLVNTYTTENQFDAAVAMQTAGDFVVVWTSDCPGGRGAYGCTSQDGDRAGVFAQRRGDPTPTATPTATPTPTNTATPTITATPGPLCSRTDSCFFFELRSADFSNPITAVFTWRLTNNCAEPLTRVDWRFVPGAMVTDPLEGGTYNSGTHTYLVDVVGGPHAGVGFTPSDGDPLTTGEFDDFTFTVARAGLSSTTVLWNNATSGSSTGRIDMMSTLCYQLPQQAAIVDASACFEESEGSWRVEVSWSAPQRDANRFDVYRRDTLANNFLRINSVAVEAGLDGRVRVVDLISPFQADKYRIVALTRDDELASGGLLDVDVGACGRVLGESHRPSQVLLVLGLVVAALVSVSVRRRRSPVPR